MPRLAPVDYRKLAKVFEKKGFVHTRTTGDHKEIPEFIILRNIKTAGMTRKEYLELLAQI